MRRIALIATMRKEEPFVLERVAWPRLIGVTEPPVCTNGRVDGSPDLLADPRRVDGAGRPLPAAYARAETSLPTAARQVSWALAQANHHDTRSREDNLVRHHRGGGHGPGRRARDENRTVCDRNEEEDLTIARHQPALGTPIAAPRADDAIRAAHDRCRTHCRTHPARLAAAA